MPGGIFVNYRRNFLCLGPGGVAHDSEPGLVEVLTDRLRRHFGADQVFLDVETMQAGDRYPEQLRRGLARAEVLIAMIGHHWLAETRYRQGLPSKDWVRWEIGEALRTDKVIVQVLLGDAPMVPADQLPADLRELAHRQVFRLRPGSFASDVDRLIAHLEQHVARTWNPPSPAPPVTTRRWIMVPALAIPVALLVTMPALVIRNPAGGRQAATELFPFTIGFALLALVFALAITAIYRWRESFDNFTKTVNEAPRNVYLYLGIGPAVLAGTVAIVQLMNSLGTPEFGPLPAVAGVLLAMLFALVCIPIVIQQYQESQEWPPLLDGRSSAPLGRLRGAIARYRERTAGWSPPLSRIQRDQTRWFRDRLAEGVREMRLRAQRSRRGSLLASRPLTLFVGSLIYASALGMMLVAGIAVYHAGHRGGQLAIGIAPAVVAVSAFLVGAEFYYRHSRWLDGRGAEEVAAYIEELNDLADLYEESGDRMSRPAVTTMSEAVG
ncbi:toll/interleukin-1 receptor domain-containing protein [Salinispora arenicola]|uniref:toll/interleukin-1 receptor domain-containing protein n=1 Tax=Salinispora arenicola TaxID=168697 RepID=UPI0003A141C9|nr:toll/interleukin-1 receptor domain-containing protein [Salinispora arenicola]